jgi:hypothetical protein
MESLDDQERRVARDQSLNMMIVDIHRINKGEETARVLAKRRGYYHPTLNPGILPGKDKASR